ncbi:hypothetical protein Leryth_001480 [Lithospermum erythrorhizon]|nr:hypothetical protein Leryth_001480 [Lithospermum erythrorhizon]
MAVVKCAVEMGIPDVLETQEHPITLEELSSLLGCHALSPLHRIMRFLSHRGLFKEEIKGNQEGHIYYTQTPLSRLLVKKGNKSMAALFLLESSPVMLAPWHQLSNRVLIHGAGAFEGAHGEDLWQYVASNPEHSKLFNDAMACDASLSVSAIIKQCPEVFEGVGTLVDVGGGNGTTLGTLVKACPWIHGINFDLAHVVETAKNCEGVERVAGDMFKSIPKGDAIFLKWTLHDWADEECIQILKNCREAIPSNNGKVIIVEAVIDLDEEGKSKELAQVGLMMDMVMLAHTTKGKERTSKEWTYVLNAAGFNRIVFKNNIQAIQSVIIGYP